MLANRNLLVTNLPFFRIFADLPAHAPGSRQELERRLQKDLASFSNPLSSISHCPGGSGYAIAEGVQARSIGFDLEVLSRIRPAIVERVSTPGEVRAAPRSEALWVAKESAFKALNHHWSLAVMAEARIGDWKVEEKTDYFSVCLATGQPILGEGFFQIQGDLILGIFIESP